VFEGVAIDDEAAQPPAAGDIEVTAEATELLVNMPMHVNPNASPLDGIQDGGADQEWQAVLVADEVDIARIRIGSGAHRCRPVHAA
jgi:hypothetical protein